MGSRLMQAGLGGVGMFASSGLCRCPRLGILGPEASQRKSMVGQGAWQTAGQGGAGSWDWEGGMGQILGPAWLSFPPAHLAGGPGGAGFVQSRALHLAQTAAVCSKAVCLLTGTGWIELNGTKLN